ncbi:unnamed protein product [Fraxinus pennsylvanica]|uniref:VWA-Hint protein Vwaint domain-containing protein n=1 Tax=Fraxinus pennsylvanica TaxID=56036 RepID=A0AAD2E6X6_9LAMI|nr:unnamed protein product [Fraxinus pennsylvanica]
MQERRAYVLSGLSLHSWQRATARGDSRDSKSLLQPYQTHPWSTCSIFFPKQAKTSIHIYREHTKTVLSSHFLRLSSNRRVNFEFYLVRCKFTSAKVVDALVLLMKLVSA